jgi:hypothetical protein
MTSRLGAKAVPAITSRTDSGGRGTATDPLTIARRYAANPQDWPLAPRFNPRRRWHQLLAAEPDGEVWVLTWLPGQGTDLHDHGGAVGGFLVIAGALTEYTIADPTGQAPRLIQSRFEADQGRSFGAHHIHRIANSGTDPAISLHAYRPALHEMTRYRFADGRLVVTAGDRTGEDWCASLAAAALHDLGLRRAPDVIGEFAACGLGGLPVASPVPGRSRPGTGADCPQ